MAFDPDSYLAKKSAPAQKPFDPDAYLAGSNPQPQSSAGLAAAEGLANTATIGYLPQIRAKAEPITDRLFNLFSAEKAEPAPWSQLTSNGPEYIKARDLAAQEMAQTEKEHPYASMAGKAGGILSTIAVAPELGIAKGARAASALPELVGAAKTAKAVRTLGALGEAGLQGGLISGLANPGDVQGQVDASQLGQRAQNAAIGTGAGLVGGLAAEGANKIVTGLKQSAPSLAIKAAGAGKPDFKRLIKQGRVDDIGNFILDKGLLKGGASAEDVLEAATKVKQDAGKTLSNIYSDALEMRTDPQFLGSIGAEQASKLENVGFKPITHGKYLKAEIAKDLEGRAGSSAALNKVSNILDDFAQKGDQVTIQDAVKMKGDLDNLIDYNKEIRDLPLAQQALKKVRRFISKRIDDEVDSVGQLIGQDKLAALKQANKEYGNSIVVENLAKNKLSQESANRMFSPSDYLAATAGAVVGGQHGETIDQKLLNAAKYAAITGLLNKGARKFGPATQAQAYKSLPANPVNPASMGLLGGQIANQSRGK